MEQMGSFFFASFITYVKLLFWPIVLVFGAYVLLELKRLNAHERVHAALMFAYFFLIIAAYWLVKPIKKALLIGYYKESGWTVAGMHFDAAQVELIAKEINLLLAILATWLFAKVAFHLKREKLSLTIMAFFATGFLGFAILFYQPGVATRWLFYFFGDFFATLMVASFFAFLNDSGDSQMARRLYGIIGLGGVLGGFFGSAVIASYVKQVSPSGVALMAIGALGVMALIAWFAGKRIAILPNEPPAPPSPTGHSVWREGVQVFIHSPYLIGIAMLVGLYEMVSTMMDYQFTSTVSHFVAEEDLGAHFSSVFAFTNFMAVLAQLFLTRWVLVRMGVTSALLVLPVAALVGEAGFVLLPGLLLGSLLNTLDNAFAYSINQSSKEALYVPVKQEVKYQGKAFIDILVLRSSKAIAALLSLLLTTALAGFENTRWLSVIVLALLVVWIMVIRNIRPIYNRMVATSTASGPLPLVAVDELASANKPVAEGTTTPTGEEQK
jgi:AAA family ATP:ADP antiporter